MRLRAKGRGAEEKDYRGLIVTEPERFSNQENSRGGKRQKKTDKKQEFIKLTRNSKRRLPTTIKFKKKKPIITHQIEERIRQFIGGFLVLSIRRGKEKHQSEKTTKKKKKKKTTGKVRDKRTPPSTLMLDARITFNALKRGK